MGRQPKRRSPGHGERLGPAWRGVWTVLYPPVSGLIRHRYEHLERLPAEGPAIVVVNHVSHVDPFSVAKLVLDSGRVPRVMAKDSIFDVPAVGAAMRGMGHIPVKRGSADAVRALQAAVAALRAGKVIVLHPEGTVTRDPAGWPMAGKTGAARVALLAPDVPVIPVAQWGVQRSYDLYHKRVRPFPRPIHVMSVGEPIDLSRFAGRGADAATLREVTEVIMLRLRHDVAALRGVAEPDGPLFVRGRDGGRADDAPSAERTAPPADTAVGDGPG